MTINLTTKVESRSRITSILRFAKSTGQKQPYYRDNIISQYSKFLTKEVLTNATTLTEVRELGKVYGVDIPRRINKKQLIDIVAIKLGFDDEKREEISKKSILEIERYAKRRKVNVSIELKKSDMIEYILIKMPKEEQPKYTASLKIFDGMNIEEYLYNLKFEEIAGKVSEARKSKIQKLVVITATIALILLVVYLSTNSI